MMVKLFAIVLILLFLIEIPSRAQSVPAKERICGEWESVHKTLRIKISMQNNQFKAIITWFSNTEGKPMNYWTDRRNPNPKLRGRKILGMSILSNLEYHPKTNSWENGRVYDSSHGRYWNASAYIDKNGLLRVRGYWHFKFIGRTMVFRRI